MEESNCEQIPNKTNDRTIVEAVDYFSPGALRILNHTVVFSFVFVLWFFFSMYSLKQLENAPGITLRQIIYATQIIKP